MRRSMRLAAAGMLIALMGVAPSAANPPIQTQRPTFRGGVDRVTVSAVVRKRNGQPITDLKREDFELLDNGRPRPILEFRSEPSPATLALLADFSGSMNVAGKLS